jgi:ferric-dicitrate binding protein FerR (iron transport regulator)
MEVHNDSKRIIGLYFGKHFSRYGRILFARWLRADDEKEEKTGVLQELWKQSPKEAATDMTYADWNALQKRLQDEPCESRTLFLSRRWMKYAAVAALLVLTAGTSFWLTDNLKPIQPANMSELFVPYGESRQLTLPDGSQVWVDAGSLLVYPKDFAKTDTRTVYLNGEASFKIQKNAKQPFIVKTTHLDVQALGTVFTVESYPDGLYTKATLEEGSIRVDVKGGFPSSSVLKPNDQLVYSRQDQTARIQTVDAALYGMERNGYLIFENTSFSQLIPALERKFNIVIHYDAQKYARHYYNVKFAPGESLADVLNILQQLVGLNYKIKGNVVFIN